MADESTWREREAASRPRGVALDPRSEAVPGITAYPTVYVPGHLLIWGDPAGPLERLQSAARAFGWTVVADPLRGDRDPDRKDTRDTRLTRAVIVQDAAVIPRVPIDAWALLQEARREALRPRRGVEMRTPVGL